jgi:hypothetical protein
VFWGWARQIATHKKMPTATTCKVIRLPEQGMPEVHLIDAADNLSQLRELQRMVGGRLDALELFAHGAASIGFYMNEEGRVGGLPLNDGMCGPVMDWLFARGIQAIYGPVVFFAVDEEGASVDFPFATLDDMVTGMYAGM